MTSRPKTLSLPPFRAVPKRYSETSGWYWQIVYQGRKGETAWSGYGTPEAVASVLAELRVAEETATSTGEIRTVGELLEYWVGSSVEPRGETGALAPASVSSYTHWAKTLKSGIGTVELVHLDQEVLDHYELDRIRAAGDKARNTIRQERVTLKMAWAWGQSRGLVPLRKLARSTIKAKEGEGYVPSRKEVALVLQELPAGWQKAALRLQGATGARISEIVSLRVQDVDLDKGLVRIWKSKTEAREVPIAPVVVGHVKAWLEESGRTHGALFVDGIDHPAPRCNGLLARACKRAGVPYWSTHALRYRAVMDMIEAGVDPKTACELTGHSLETMLKVYRKVSGPGKRAAVQLAQLGYLPEATGDVIEWKGKKT